MEVQPFHCRQLPRAHFSPQPHPGVPGDEPEDARDGAGPRDAEGSHASPLAPRPSCMPEGADPPPRPLSFQLRDVLLRKKPTKGTTDGLGKIPPELRDNLQLIENRRRESFTNPTGIQS